MPNAQITGNFSLYLRVNITNRLSANSASHVTDVIFTYDNGSGPQAITAPGMLGGPGTPSLQWHKLHPFADRHGKPNALKHPRRR